MYKFPIGVIVDSFRIAIPDAVKKAAEIGAQGIQVYSSNGEMAPENLSQAKRIELKKLVENGEGNKPVKLSVNWDDCDHLQNLRAFSTDYTGWLLLMGYD